MPKTININNDLKLYPNKQSNLTLKEHLNKRLKKPIESIGRTYPRHPFFGIDLNGFIGALHVAYQNHYSLTLSPDDVWLCISQGLANYINENANELRTKFVDFTGKKVIRIEKSDFVRKQQNPWELVFDKFSSEIKNYIGNENHQTIIGDFSTTLMLEKVVSEIVLMDAMKSYFDYRVMTMCGIPSINLLGKREDWQKIIDKVKRFEKYNCELDNLDWWVQKLLPVLQQFVNVFDDNIDVGFWNNIYKLAGGSGGDRCTGWCNVFFPYVKKYDETVIKNPELIDKKSLTRGVETGSYLSGISNVKFIWEYYEKEFDYLFIGGFNGYTILDDNSITPLMFYAVAENVDNKENTEEEKQPTKQNSTEKLRAKVSTIDNNNICVYSKGNFVNIPYTDKYKESLAFVKLLNDCLVKDESCINGLFDFKMPANNLLDNSKDVITTTMIKNNKEVPALRILGLINGYLLGIGASQICTYCDEYSPDIICFCIIKQN